MIQILQQSICNDLNILCKLLFMMVLFPIILFFNIEIPRKEAKRQFLTEEELNKLMSKCFGLKRLEQVRDIFVFSCFTGMAYIDIYNLERKNITKGFDGSLWITGERTKTDITYRIPLLKTPFDILRKYASHAKRPLPVVCNQRMNSYLKEIADLCGIEKNLTFHMARHTFATTVTLSNDVPIESVSKMLGHTKISTTQIYAKIIDKKLSNDMRVLSQKLNSSQLPPAV